jgi:hypothetical protein
MTTDADSFNTLQGQVESGHPEGGASRLSPGLQPGGFCLFKQYTNVVVKYIKTGQGIKKQQNVSAVSIDSQPPIPQRPRFLS